MRALLAGMVTREALVHGATGSVAATFAKACYLEIDGVQVVLVAPGVHPGPLHVVLDAAPPRPEPGTAVRVDAERLVAGDVVVDLSSAAGWEGALVPPGAVRANARSITEVATSAAGRTALRAEPFAAPAGRARALLEEGHLAEAGRLLGGLGPGLTPSGDDALAGIAFALRLAFGPAGERVARRAATATVSRFGTAAGLAAARGQVLAPVHELMSAVVRGDLEAGRSAAAAVAAVGETSGADLLEGLGWVLGGDAVYALAAAEGLELEPAAIAR